MDGEIVVGVEDGEGFTAGESAGGEEGGFGCGMGFLGGESCGGGVVAGVGKGLRWGCCCWEGLLEGEEGGCAEG